MSKPGSRIVAICIFALAAESLNAQTQTIPPAKGGEPGKRLPVGSSSAETENLQALLRDLTAELRALRLELLEQRAEYQDEKIAQLEREIVRVRRDKSGVEEQEHALNQQLADLDDQLGQPSIAAVDRSRLEAMRAEIAGSGIEGLHTERQRTAQRERDLNKRRRQTAEYRQELLERAVQLKALVGDKRQE